jgi:uncharacterized protein YukJ
MPLKRYSVLKGRIEKVQEERDNSTPHFQILVNSNDKLFRIAVNVMSADEPSTLKYMVVSDFEHALSDKLAILTDGLHSINSKPGGVALDYIRSNLFDITKMKTIPHNVPGDDNDLNDLLDMYASRAMRTLNSRVYAFGEVWGPENKKDQYFGFQPGQGIHDIHMNQGNSGQWKSDNGVYQDGGLLFHFPNEDQWVGVFLAFQNQAIHTDNQTGNPLDFPEPDVVSSKDMRIIAALVNPPGDDPGLETVTLINVSDKSINLAGWFLEDKNGKKEDLPSQLLNSVESIRIVLSGQGVQLSNDGGQITLWSPNDGVSYPKDQASKVGWTLIF